MAKLSETKGITPNEELERELFGVAAERGAEANPHADMVAQAEQLEAHEGEIEAQAKATNLWYEGRKSLDDRLKIITSYKSNHFRIGWNLTEKQFLMIEERIADLFMVDDNYNKAAIYLPARICHYEIEQVLKAEFRDLVCKDIVPGWWAEDARRGWIRKTALWMSMIAREFGKDTLQDNIQNKRSQALQFAGQPDQTCFQSEQAASPSEGIASTPEKAQEPVATKPKMVKKLVAPIQSLITKEPTNKEIGKRKLPGEAAPVGENHAEVALSSTNAKEDSEIPIIPPSKKAKTVAASPNLKVRARPSFRRAPLLKEWPFKVSVRGNPTSNHTIPLTELVSDEVRLAIEESERDTDIVKEHLSLARLCRSLRESGVMHHGDSLIWKWHADAEDSFIKSDLRLQIAVQELRRVHIGNGALLMNLEAIRAGGRTWRRSPNLF